MRFDLALRGSPKCGKLVSEPFGERRVDEYRLLLSHPVTGRDPCFNEISAMTPHRLSQARFYRFAHVIVLGV